MSSYSGHGPSASPPYSRFRDHSPTKSSPLRHTVSTRSNNSDADTSSLPSRQPTVSSNAGSAYSEWSQSASESSQDPFIARTAVKRDRSESPVKKSALFAQWEEREQAQQELKNQRVVGKMDVSPKKIRDDEWRSNIGLSESRPALRPVTPNSVTITAPSSSSTTPVHQRIDSKENVVEQPAFADKNLLRTPSPTSHTLRHSRSQSEDAGRYQRSLQTSSDASPSLAARNSLATLNRSDSIRSGSKPPRPQGHVRFQSADAGAPHLDEEDLGQLEKSSTPQLRHLSKLALEKGGTDELEVHSAEEQVVGLAGRRRLQRSGSMHTKTKQQSQFASQYASTKWIDLQRKHLQAYEYLCHVGEARAWIEDVLDPTKLPPIVQLEEALRDGVTLAEVVVRLAPELPSEQQHALGSQRIFRSPRLQFRHSDNIALFFRFLGEVELPELFRFELVDLYEKKNIPKVIYCIHALSWILFRKGIVSFRIGNLVGQLQFEDHELEETQKGIERSGVQMPNFGGMREAMQIEEEPPPPEPSPEELLAESEEMILDLQSQVRGALVRLNLGVVMQDLWTAEDAIAQFQALARGGFAREIFNFRHGMDRSTRLFQAMVKGFLQRRKQQQQQANWTNNTQSVIAVQSLWRGRQQRAQTKFIKSRLSRNTHGLKELQASIRGALSRWKAGDLWYEARDESNEARILQFQALARGAVERMKIHAVMNDLWDAENAIVQLQGLIRGFQRRRERKNETRAVQSVAVELVSLQAAMKGLLCRKRNTQRHGEWKLHNPAIVETQAVARGLLERLRQSTLTAKLVQCEPGVTHLQALIRAKAARSLRHGERHVLDSNALLFTKLQALVRGKASRQRTDQIRSELQQGEESIFALQTLARGMLERRRIGDQLMMLEDQEQELVAFQSFVRAYLERQRVFKVLVEMEREDEAITRLQAFARAVLLRSSIGDTLAELEDHEEPLMELQAAIRGFSVRNAFFEKQRHYHENMQKVIKLQSFVRAKQQGESYQSLVNGKNPPLPVVRRHLHLLTDSNLEFESEMEAERMRRQIAESVRRNELVQGYVDGLDNKIALLVRNKITVDEFRNNQRQFGLLRSSSMLAHGNGLDLKALNKNSKRKLTGYEELIFVLQTQPQYMGRLLNHLSYRGLPEHETKNVERLVLALFGGNMQKTREEYFMLKLLGDCMRQLVGRCQTIEDYKRQQQSAFHQRIMNSYVKGHKERAYVKTLLSGVIKDGICGQEHLDLESDPLQIYRAILNNEELSTGRQSQRPRDLPREIIIREEDVRARYVEHLENLRDIGDSFFLSLEEVVHRMPFGIRYLALEQHRTLCSHYPRESPDHLLLIVGAWLWRSYFLRALQEPEHWGLIDRGLGPQHKRNLAQVILVLTQVATVGAPFDAENIYLQPLSGWISEASERWFACLHHLLDVPSPEEHFDMDQFADLYATRKPTLYIKLADIFALHRLITDNVSAVVSNRDDQIKEILTDLGSPKSNESDFGSSSNNAITLTLRSKYTVQEDPNAELRALFTATKRLVLYIIRVQSGSNLMEILLRPITHEDADRWLTLLQEDIAASALEKRSNPRPASAYGHASSARSKRALSVYSEAPSALSSDDQARDLHDLQHMTYAELKSNALENILALEQPSVSPQFRVSRHNAYQEILNALAADIRMKHRKRLERQHELDSIRSTLAQLDRNALDLEDKLKSYNDHIESVFHTLASKKGSRAKFLIPFTKQWSHVRELERSGRKPRFGSYKYSAQKLAEKGLLLSWHGYPQENWGQLNFVISSDDVGVFHLEASSGSLMLPGASANLLLDDLLQAQYDDKRFITVFEEAVGGGGAQLAVNILLHLIFKKFYGED